MREEKRNKHTPLLSENDAKPDELEKVRNKLENSKKARKENPTKAKRN